MASLVRFIALSLIALLPREYQNRWEWTSEASLRYPAIVSGLAEAVICLALVIVRYFWFIDWRLGTIAAAALKRPGGDEVLAAGAVQYGAGFATLVEYIFRPLTVLLIYFTIEGALRFFAALITYEYAGTLPLCLAAWGWERLQREWKEHQLGPRVPDAVEHCKGISYDLCIASCRPKPGWNHLVTVEYEDQLYELYDERKGGPPRPHIYLLRKLSPQRIIRGLHHYHPHEALTEKQRRALLKETAEKEEK